MAQDPFRQLAVIGDAVERGKLVQDCYRLFYKEALWIEAFKNITGKAPDEYDLQLISRLIICFRNGAFRFGKSHQRKNEEYSIEDQLVVEMILFILTNVFAPLFLELQVNRPLPEVLNTVKTEFPHMTWCMKGIVKNWSLESSRTRLMKTFAEKFADRRFLLLLNGLLKSGLFTKKEGNLFYRKEQFRRLRSLFFNIYFHDCDHIFRILQNGKNKVICLGDHTKEFIEKILSLTDGKELVYIRYGREFIIGLQGKKADAKAFKEVLENWLLYQFHLGNSQLDLCLTDLKRPVLFSGYAIRHYPMTKSSGETIIRLEIPKQSLVDFARKKGYGVLDCFQAKERGMLIHRSEREIIDIYNRELLAFARYYRYADNFHAITPLYYLAKKSMLKTLAQKRSISIKKLIRKSMVVRDQTLYLQQMNREGHPELFPFVSLASLKKLKKNFS